MKRTTLPPLWAMVLLLAFALAATAVRWSIEKQAHARLGEEALRLYRHGLEASTLAERELYFNDALRLYLDLETSYGAQDTSGALPYNIGNSYFQLGELPRALLYYYRALHRNPGHLAAQKNLQLALARGPAPIAEETALPSHLFSTSLGPNRRLFQWFIGLALASTLLASLAIWRPSTRLWKWLALLIALITIVPLLLVSWHQLLVGPKAVLLRATPLYHLVDGQLLPLEQEPPLSAGTLVELVGETQQGHWWQLLTPNGRTGYVPAERLAPL